MKVLISDPAAKAKRTDAQDAVLFVGGLHARTTEQDVTELIQVVRHGALLQSSRLIFLARDHQDCQAWLGPGQGRVQRFRLCDHVVGGELSV